MSPRGCASARATLSDVDVTCVGGAFGKITTSFVNDVLMPPIGLLLGGVHFGALSLTLRAAIGESEAVLLRYGAFINTVIDFIIIAFAIFAVVRLMNSMTQKEEEAPPAAPKEEVLLT